ncbi:MAG: hypothetical protein KAI43_13255 [Candidatus Aureabacteria bacterium]|nr:hypothetical protein [Candidatus Auribacterota bacterium]
MKVRNKIILSCIALLLITTFAHAEDKISWKDANNYIGQNKTVTGKIVGSFNSGKACFLNFHSDYKKHFTAVIFKSAFNKFSDNPEDYYYGKEVEVTGMIKEYQGKSEIILNSPNQIKIVGGDTAKKTDKIVSWKDANDYIGQYITVEGTIVATYNSGKACFLNFHRNYKKYFTAVIFASNYHKFNGKPEVIYKGKKVQITGMVKKYEGKSEIIVGSPGQIKIVEN